MCVYECMCVLCVLWLYVWLDVWLCVGGGWRGGGEVLSPCAPTAAPIAPIVLSASSILCPLHYTALHCSPCPWMGQIPERYTLIGHLSSRGFETVASGLVDGVLKVSAVHCALC